MRNLVSNGLFFLEITIFLQCYFIIFQYACLSLQIYQIAVVLVYQNVKISISKAKQGILEHGKIVFLPVRVSKRKES